MKLTYKKKIAVLRARAHESIQHKLRKDFQPRKGATRKTNENRCHEAKTYATQNMVKIFERYGYAVQRLA